MAALPKPASSRRALECEGSRSSGRAPIPPVAITGGPAQIQGCKLSPRRLHLPAPCSFLPALPPHQPSPKIPLWNFFCLFMSSNETAWHVYSLASISFASCIFHSSITCLQLSLTPPAWPLPAAGPPAPLRSLNKHQHRSAAM